MEIRLKAHFIRRAIVAPLLCRTKLNLLSCGYKGNFSPSTAMQLSITRSQKNCLKIKIFQFLNFSEDIALPVQDMLYTEFVRATAVQ